MTPSSTLDLQQLSRVVADLSKAVADLSPQTTLSLSALCVSQDPPPNDHRGRLAPAPSEASVRAGQTLIALKAYIDETFAAAADHQARIKNAHAAIHTLPDEVLLSIFDYVRGPADRYRCTIGPPMDNMLHLTAVCFLWREICRSHSPFWDWITISNSRQAEMVESLLPLSRDRSVRVSIYTEDWYRSLEGLMVRLPLEGLDRITEMDFQHPEHLKMFEVPDGANFEHVTALYIGTHRRSRPQEGSESQPIRIGHDERTSSFPGLQSLRLCVPAQLDEFPNLRYLELSGIRPGHCARSLRSLASRSLNHLELTSLPTADDEDEELEQGGPAEALRSVHTLTIRGDLSPSLAQFFLVQPMPQLDVLHLITTRSLRGIPLMLTMPIHVLEIINDPPWVAEVLKLLRPSDDPAHDAATVLPQLRELVVQALRPANWPRSASGFEQGLRDVNDQLFLSLSMRYARGVPDLQRLTLTPSILDARKNAGWFAMNVEGLFDLNES